MKIKEFFQSLVKAGTIPQEPMNYDAATLKIYIDHLEAENATMCETVKREKHHAKVAERALLTACVNLIKDKEDNVNMELLARAVYTNYLRKAEKELAEERKDEQMR